MIKQHAVRATLTALTLGVALGLAGCGGGNDPGGMSGMGHSPSSPQMSQLPSSTASSSDSSPSTAVQFNDADATFVQEMLPHHKQAVEMSNTLLQKSGVSAETTVLAKQIKAAQQPEITTMEGWLKDWGKSADPGMGGMDHGGMGGGMATDAEMKKFAQADGASAEKMYLEMMTKHHQGAITMAETEIKNGQNPNAVQLANTVASSQQAEIDTMLKLMANL